MEYPSAVSSLHTPPLHRHNVFKRHSMRVRGLCMLGVSLATEAAGGRWPGKCSMVPCARLLRASVAFFPLQTHQLDPPGFLVQTGAVAKDGRLSPFPGSQESGTMGSVEACGQRAWGCYGIRDAGGASPCCLPDWWLWLLNLSLEERLPHGGFPCCFCDLGCWV